MGETAWSALVLLSNIIDHLFQDTLVAFMWLLKHLWLLLLWLKSQVFRLVEWFLPNERGTLPDYVPLYVLMAVVLYAAIKGRRQATLISPFHIPKSENFPFNENTIANVLRDAFVAIKREAERGVRTRSSQLIEPGPERSKALILPEVTHFEVPTRFAVEVKGLSYEGLVSVARKVWGVERVISGDLLLDSSEFSLVARTQEEGPWQVDPRPLTLRDLQVSCRELALKILADLSPELVAAHEIAQGDVGAAYQRLLELIQHAEG